MTERAYLSILKWPEGSTPQEQVELLARTAGIDPFTGKQRVAHCVPQVVTVLDVAAVESTLGALRDAGAVAMAPSDSEIQGVPSARLAKSLSAAEGSPAPMYMIEYWREIPDGFLCSDVFLIVRARVGSSIKRVNVPDGLASPMCFSGDMLGGELASALTPPAPVISRRMRLTHIVDLYTTQGGRVRVDSDKFNFSVLGIEKGITDTDNMDKLSLRLAQECRGALIDTGFKTFRAAPGVSTGSSRTIRSSTIERRDDHPAFEFYSAWSSLAHRSLLAR